MEVSHLEQIFAALDEARVRYLVVGGLAVLAHGYMRYTNDIDLFVDLEDANALAAVTVLDALGYRPRVPVLLANFGDAAARRTWVEGKGMVVLQLDSPRFPRESIDLFVEAPFAFAAELTRAAWLPLGATLKMPVVSLSRLIEMKRAVDRPRDRADVAELEKLERLRRER